MSKNEELFKEIYDTLEKETKDLFKKAWETHQEQIKAWVKTIAELKLKQTLSPTPITEKDLEYAFAAIKSLKHQLVDEIADNTWMIIEKVLQTIIRTLFLISVGK